MSAYEVEPIRSCSAGEGFDAFDLLEMLRPAADEEGGKVRACTPHGSYTFDIVGFDDFGDGDVLLRLRPLSKPRIPEPGLWGVVEACDGGEPEPRMPRTYVRDSLRDEDPHWTAVGHGVRVEWDDLIDPVLVREGVA